jgi:ribonuclease HI
MYEKAVTNQRATTITTMIFTDGSGYGEHIGASTASLQHGVNSERRYLGTESQSTVYAAELNGIEMALAAVAAKNDIKEQQAREVIIFSDSQAAI